MTDARQKLSECNGLGQMFARFGFVLALSIGLFRGNECAHAQSESSTTQILPPIVVSRTAPAPQQGQAQNPRRTFRALPPRFGSPTTPVPALPPRPTPHTTSPHVP